MEGSRLEKQHPRASKDNAAQTIRESGDPATATYGSFPSSR